MKLTAALLLSLLAVSALAEPPGRVGRISVAEGEVLFAHDDANPAAAVINTPVSTGDSLRTGEAARAEVQIGSVTLHVGENSRVHLTQVDDFGVHAYLVHGVLLTHLRDESPNFELTAPRLDAAFAPPGHYRVDVAEDGASITVREGEAVVTRSTGERFHVARNETAVLADAARHTIRRGIARDRLESWAAARLDNEDRTMASRYLSREMTGYQDLDDYGAWEETVEYGPVWAPGPIYSGWAPYRDGRWSFVHPWGWTWIDHAPWGFAPFHYGHWTLHKKVWCWVPGPFVKKPHYAPALVKFPHGHKHFHHAPKVWQPLAPHHPWKSSHPKRHHREVITHPPAYLAHKPAAGESRAGQTHLRGMRVPRGASFTDNSRDRSVSEAYRPLPAQLGIRGLSYGTPANSPPRASMNGNKGIVAPKGVLSAPATGFRSNGAQGMGRRGSPR